MEETSFSAQVLLKKKKKQIKTLAHSVCRFNKRLECKADVELEFTGSFPQMQSDKCPSLSHQQQVQLSSCIVSHSSAPDHHQETSDQSQVPEESYNLGSCLIPLSIESIMVSSSSSSSLLSMKNLPREARLVIYALGIFFCYFFFGIFQEKMWVFIICNSSFACLCILKKLTTSFFLNTEPAQSMV